MKRQLLSVAMALLIVSGTTAVAVQTGMVDRRDVDPVGQAEALACGGVCLAGGVGIAAGIAVGAVAGSEFLSDSSVDTEELNRLDALETKKEMHSKSATQHQNNLIMGDSMNNYLSDTPEVATMIGKNAYIKALENGSSEAEARADAREAVADYYAKKEIQLIQQYQVSFEQWQSMYQVAQNDSNINNGFVAGANAEDNVLNGSQFTETISEDSHSVTLVNGTESQNVTTVKVTNTDTAVSSTLTPEYVESGTGVYLHGLGVNAPTDNYTPTYIINVTKYGLAMQEIDSQNTQVQGRIDNFVNNTYNEYQAGDINSTDLVDPYLGAREYSPDGDYGAFTLRTMSTMGLDSPADLSNVGTMTVEDLETGDTYKGVLLTDDTPSGGIQNGETYDAAALSGPQLVVSEEDTKTYELNGNFTVTNITTTDGNVTSSVEYRDVNYQTTNISEYKALQEELRNLTAQINARQAETRTGGGGGLLGGANIDPTVAIVLIAGIAAAVMYGNSGGGRNGRRR